jgi:PAS domain-containing protein
VSADQYPVEIIMARGLISNLTTPAFMVDQEGTLIFFNEAAGDILGLQYQEAGPMPASEWGSRFTPMRADGEPVPAEELPLVIAVREGRAAHTPLRIRSARGETRDIEVTAFPIVGREGQSAAIAIFWE